MAGHSANIVLLKNTLKCINSNQIITSKLKNWKAYDSGYKFFSSHSSLTGRTCLLRLASLKNLSPLFTNKHLPPPPPIRSVQIFTTRTFSSTTQESGDRATVKRADPRVTNEGAVDGAKQTFDNMTIGFETKPDDDDTLQTTGDDPSKAYNENTLIPDFRAIKEFLLTYGDLHKLPSMTRRSPYYGKPYITVYHRKDLERRAIEKWGSLKNLEIRKKSMQIRLIPKEKEGFVAEDLDSSKKDEKAVPYEDFNFYQTTEDAAEKKNPYGVVTYAIGFNALNCFLKMGAWLYTGSHSMFAEFIHSVADTVNQIILYIGIKESMKEPDLAHPYGFAKIRNITSLMSGLGIFFLGAGLNIYHGITGLVNPGGSSSLYWALAVLGTSFVTEGATLVMALNKLRENSKQANMGLYQYFKRTIDPTTNVVVLEDSAAVLGTLIAATCISIAHFTPYAFADPVGSLLSGTLLGGMATIIIYTNAGVLVGRSIPDDKRKALVSELEAHKMIRSTIDVKATEVGGKSVKFKAEVDFDGREITKHYLHETNVDNEELLREMQELKTPEEAREYLLKHGEGIVDMVGIVIDDIEREFKGKHPEIKYCDLEQL